MTARLMQYALLDPVIIFYRTTNRVMASLTSYFKSCILTFHFDAIFIISVESQHIPVDGFMEIFEYYVTSSKYFILNCGFLFPV